MTETKTLDYQAMMEDLASEDALNTLAALGEKASVARVLFYAKGLGDVPSDTVKAGAYFSEAVMEYVFDRGCFRRALECDSSLVAGLIREGWLELVSADLNEGWAVADAASDDEVMFFEVTEGALRGVYSYTDDVLGECGGETVERVALDWVAREYAL